MKKGKLLPMKIAGGVLLVLLLAVAGYVVYVFTQVLYDFLSETMAP